MQNSLLTDSNYLNTHVIMKKNNWENYDQKRREEGEPEFASDFKVANFNFMHYSKFNLYQLLCISLLYNKNIVLVLISAVGNNQIITKLSFIHSSPRCRCCWWSSPTTTTSRWWWCWSSSSLSAPVWTGRLFLGGEQRTFVGELGETATTEATAAALAAVFPRSRWFAAAAGKSARGNTSGTSEHAEKRDRAKASAYEKQ